MRRQHVKNCPPHLLIEHVAAVRPSIAEDSVVQQNVRRVLMRAEQRRIEASRGMRRAGLQEPEIRGQRCKADGRIDPPVFEKRQFAELEETEAAAALPTDCFRDATLLALNYFRRGRQCVCA